MHGLCLKTPGRTRSGQRPNCQKEVRQGIVRLPEEASLKRPKRLARCDYNTTAKYSQGHVPKSCLALRVISAIFPLPAPSGGRERIGRRCVGPCNRKFVRLHRVCLSTKSAKRPGKTPGLSHGPSALVNYSRPQSSPQTHRVARPIGQIYQQRHAAPRCLISKPFRVRIAQGKHHAALFRIVVRPWRLFFQAG